MGSEKKDNSDLWFRKPIFEGILDEDDEEDTPIKTDNSSNSESEDETEKNRIKKKLKTEIVKVDDENIKKSKKEREGFEEVPKEDIEYDTDEDSEDDIDSDERIQVLALGKHLLRRKSKQDLLDNAYNRYAFNDPNNLPEWFLEDEAKHNKPQLPLTKADVEALKDKMKAVDARPIKKIAEAKARKKHKMQKKLDQIKQKAVTVASTHDLSEKEKLKQIAKLYKGVPVDKKTKIYMVSKKHKQTTGGPKRKKKGKVKIVDPRMKKDKRAAKVQEKKRKR